MNLFRSALLALLACLVAACAQPDERETGGSDAPNPLLWEVARSDGSVEGWLMGTIHALPDGARWRNGAIDRAVADADILVMEIDDVVASARVAHPRGVSACSHRWLYRD